MNNWQLEDIIIRKKEAGENFYVPSAHELSNLQINDIVKLIFINNLGGDNERMWVQITEKSDGGLFSGILVNHPVNIAGLNYGDSIIFSINNVIDIYDK